MITPLEYVQLKAFARQDGALLAVLWIGSFCCYMLGLTKPLLGLLAILMAASTPFFAAARLRHFRDYAREGVISFRRGYAYTILIFFYGGLLLSAAMFVYFHFMDKGYLLSKFTELVYSEEGQRALQVYHMKEEMAQGLKEMAALRPIDYAVNMLTVNIASGFMLGLPIAAIMQKVKR